ncbi:MAG: hypothetical protein HYV16_04125 [Gammaproteobacteria bacterium]|nr:hypothetical protein [Gammaproteobacteria bacterium]
METYPYQPQALQAYGVLAVVVFLLAWWLARRWWAWLKISLLSLTGALAFTPAFVFPDKDFVAPAIVHLIFDAGQHLHDGQLAMTLQRDLTPIALVFAVLFILGALLHFVLPKSRAEKERDMDDNRLDRRLEREQRATGRKPRREPDAEDEPPRRPARDRVLERIEPEIHVHRSSANKPRGASPRR